MSRFKIVLVSGVLALAVAGPPATYAAEPVPADRPALEKRLASYDPATVEAAAHYYKAPARQQQLLMIFDNVQKRMVGEIVKQNPSFNKDQIAKTLEIATGAMKDRVDLLMDMSMVVALEKLTPAEMIALDKFYSSPEGLGIVAKMPGIALEMQVSLKAVVPAYVAEVKKELKASYPELML